MPPIKIELWTDEQTGRCYVEEFLDTRQVLDAGEVIEILEHDFQGRYLAELYRDEKIRYPQDDLLYLRIYLRDKKIRLLGCLRGRTLFLVHGLVRRGPDIPTEDIQTAVERIKRIPNEYGS